MPENLRAHIRKRAGLTQVKLARITGISQARISAWETENVDLTPGDVAKVARAIREHLDCAPQFENVDDLARALVPNLPRANDQPNQGDTVQTSKH